VPVDGLASILVTEYHEGTKPALFVVRAFHGARRPYACRCGFFRRGGRDLFCGTLYLRVRLTRVIRLCVARVSPEARRPNACRSMVWLRFWSPSITRVRSQLFLWYAPSTGPVGPTRIVVEFSVEAEETSTVVRFV
jgi:hypothetical protein